MIITVYSRPNCVQCDATKRWLNKNERPYTEKPLDQHPEILEEAKAAGYTAAPVVILELHGQRIVWGGFQITKLKEAR